MERFTSSVGQKKVSAKTIRSIILCSKTNHRKHKVLADPELLDISAIRHLGVGETYLHLGVSDSRIQDITSMMEGL